MTTADPTAESPVGPGEQASSRRIAGGLEGLRTLVARRPAGTSLFASMDRVLTVAGSVVLPLGLVAIFLGWYGAARTPLLFEQIPYLISGGLLGVGLMLGGGMLFFGSWLARMADQDRRANQELIVALDEVRAAVLATSAGPVASADGSAAGGASLVATPTGTMVHRPTCSVVAHREDQVAVTPGADMKPCKICEPELTSLS